MPAASATTGAAATSISVSCVVSWLGLGRRRHRLRNVSNDGLAVYLTAVHIFARILGILHLLELDVGEALVEAGVQRIGRHVKGFHGAIEAEYLLQMFPSDVAAQMADVDARRFGRRQILVFGFGWTR